MVGLDFTMVLGPDVDRRYEIAMERRNVYIFEL